MDGSIWEIVRGADFEGTRRMQARLHHYATHRGYRVQARCGYEPGRETVVFRYARREQGDAMKALPALSELSLKPGASRRTGRLQPAGSVVWAAATRRARAWMLGRRNR